ncbi:MAG: polysaccharide deacetylase [Clostridiales bacterium]|nr:polysaccharide deacetylase [Clostridiales bacterium]
MTEQELLRRRREQRRRRKRRRQLRGALRLAGSLLLCVLLTAGYAILSGVTVGRASAAGETETQTEALDGTDETGGQTEEQVSQKEAERESNEPEEPSYPEPDPDSVIYLTFDDGPSSTITAEILDVLEENCVQATFFIVDYSEDKLPLLERMIEDGDTVGIHAMDHDYEACYSSEDAYLDGVEELKEKLYQDTGYEAFCLRFPGGSSNTISVNYNEGIMTRLTQRVADLGMEYFDWNVDSEDASGNGVPDSTLVTNVTSELKKGRDNIVLMHDANGKKTTVQALQSIINYGRENGYTFKAIDRSTTPVHHRVGN